MKEMSEVDHREKPQIRKQRDSALPKRKAWGQCSEQWARQRLGGDRDCGKAASSRRTPKKHSWGTSKCRMSHAAGDLGHAHEVHGAFLFSFVVAPCAVEAEIGIIFRHAEDGMSIGEEELKTGIAEIVVAADVDERGFAGFGGERAFAAVGKNFAAEREFFADVALEKPSAERKIVEAVLRVDDFAGAAVGGPRSKTFLHPDGQTEPNFADAEAEIAVAGGGFEHGEGADHRAALGFLNEADFRANFRVAEAEVAHADAGAVVTRIVIRKNCGGGHNEMELDVGNYAPVEFDGGTAGVDFGAGAVHIAEDVEFVMAEVDGLGIIGLEWRAGFCGGAGDAENGEGEQGRASEFESRHSPVLSGTVL